MPQKSYFRRIDRVFIKISDQKFAVLINRIASWITLLGESDRAGIEAESVARLVDLLHVGVSVEKDRDVLLGRELFGGIDMPVG